VLQTTVNLHYFLSISVLTCWVSGAGTCSGSTGTNGWLCQHRWVGVAGMTGFRNNVTGAITNWVSPASNRIAFGRGSTGFVAINNADSSWTATFTTSLAAGTYCDVVSGPVKSSSACSAGSYVLAFLNKLGSHITLFAGSPFPHRGHSPPPFLLASLSPSTLVRKFQAEVAPPLRRQRQLRPLRPLFKCPLRRQ
jgi:hypothetical protein